VVALILKVYTSLSGVDSIRHNFNHISNPQFSNGVPVLMERIRDCWKEEELYEDLSGVKANPKSPEFITGKLISAGYGTPIFTTIKRVVDRLNQEFPGKYVFQLPSDQAVTAKAYYEKNMPENEKLKTEQASHPSERKRGK
jgi:hypothetical protein